MKRLLGLFLSFVMIFSILGATTAEATVTKYKNKKSEQFLWEELKKYEISDQVRAGILGYYMRESQLRSDAVAGWPQRNKAKNVTDICKEFTAKVDKGLEKGTTRKYFAKMVRVHYGGYGLGQWSAVKYLYNYYDFVQKRGGSIADAELQVEFTVKGIQANKQLWKQIKNEKDPYIVGKLIGYLYDGTRGIGAETIGSYAKQYYKTYGGKK